MTKINLELQNHIVNTIKKANEENEQTISKDESNEVVLSILKDAFSKFGIDISDIDDIDSDEFLENYVDVDTIRDAESGLY